MRSRSKHGKARHSLSQNLGKEKQWRSLNPQRTALCLNPSTHSCLVIITDVYLNSCTDCISQDLRLLILEVAFLKKDIMFGYMFSVLFGHIIVFKSIYTGNFDQNDLIGFSKGLFPIPR